MFEALHRSDVVNPQHKGYPVLVKHRRLLLSGNLISLVPCDSSVFCNLVHTPCFLCPTAVAKRLTSSRSWISSDTIFLLFDMNSLDHQRCGYRPRPAFRFATVPIISFILRADSAFSTAIFAFYFWPVITGGWAFFTSGPRESHSIWKSRPFPNLYSSASDNVGSFSFVIYIYIYIISILFVQFVLSFIFFFTY